MYGGGTFKKLYNVEKGGDSGVIKGRKSINPEHEVVPGPKKKLSTVHKETIATTGSAINITSSNETVCHPGCPPAKPSLISAADYDLKTSHLHASNSFLKTPLRRNLSLSILPLPSVASLGGHKTSSLSSVETGGLTNEEKHTDPTPQLCGAHVPSDRKKQRTDDKITSPLKMEVNPSTMSHPPPSIVGSRPQHDTHLSYINLQTNQKHMQLKGVLFPPCIINANALSVNTSPATSISSAAKTSFLPKYQLKLPNADSNTSLHVGDKPTGIEDHTFTSALSSSHNDQTSPLVTTSEKKDSDPVTSPLMQTCEMKKTFSTTQAHLLSPCMATTLCQVKTSRFNENAAPSLSVVQRPFAATTITTTCLKDYQSGLCSTSIQPSRSDTASVPLQLHRPVEPTVAHIPAMPLITTASNQTSTAAVTAFSQSQSNSNPPLSHSQLSTASDPVNRAYASPNTASVPCHIVPCDMVQPAAQNVFHVHTADLQICLQLISDEQLALIEPQIENQADSSLSQRSMEALGPEVTQSKVQSSVTMEISSEGRGHQHLGHQKEMDQSGSLATLHMESTKPPLSVHFGKVQPNIHMIEHSNSSQAAVSAESKPPETLGLMLHPHKYSHVNTATETLNSSSSAMSAAASHKGVKSGRRQTSQEERTPSLNHCAEEQLLLDRRVSQGQLVSQTLSGQHSLSVTCLSPSTVNQNSTRSDLLEKESQQKLSSRLESGEPHPSLQVKSSQASSVAGADELSGLVSTFSFNKCKTPRQLKPQASIYSGNPAEPTLSETLNPSQQASRGCDRVGPLDNSSPLQEMTFNESQDVICSAHSEQQLGLFTSVTSNIQVERPRNTPAVLTHIQSPSTGLTEGASQMGCAAQKESQTWAHGGLSLGQPDSTDWRPKQSREAGETNHHSVEGQGGGAVMGEDNNRGIKSDQVPDQWGNTKTKCRYMGSSDMLKPVGEDKQVKADSCKNSWLSEQDLQHHSQTHSEMFECPPQSPLQAPSSSGNLNMPVSSGTTGLFNSAQPLLEMSNFYFSQQHWESSIIHNHQAQRILSEFSSSEHIKEQDKSQNAFSQIECSPQQRFPLQDEKQDQKQKSSSLSPDVKTSSIRHYCQVSHSVQGSRATAGYKGDNNMLDNRLPSKTFNYAEPEQNTKDWASNDYTVQSSNSGRPDTTNKYQSLLLAGQLQGYQSAECLTSGVRPVQSCQDYAGDTSSSDDEGKLIIALGEK
uniref:uncharacterized protein LOC109970612 n=1 Tax=Monopterus albus TaxID=43700 RepID=UPI0009B40695|nr:uncharacterized protein LOC109970612 [Monopterus albus]